MSFCRSHMEMRPKRKQLRMDGYDYAAPGAYFVTICTENREKIFWLARRGELRSPADVQLSAIGNAVEREIRKLDAVYDAVTVDTYCVMPDHIHMILTIRTDVDGRTLAAPTISRVVKQFKGAVTKQAGRPIWQRPFYDHGIRNQQDYNEIWEYIAYNPLKYIEKRTP